MKFFYFLPLVLLFFCSNVLAQDLNLFGLPNHLYKIEKKMIDGDKNALFELAEYFDSQKQTVEFLGYHRIETTKSKTAKRIAQENSIFTSSEIDLTEKTSKKKFLDFLKANESKIVYSKEADAFLLTPLENRSVEFEILAISPNKRRELQTKFDDLLKLEWVKKDGIDALISSKNPEALFRIASHLFRERSRWNRYYFDEENDIALLQYLTDSQIAVKNEKNEFSYHIESDYPPDSKLNLLIFFAKYYKNYKFDNERNIFVNAQFSAKSKPLERLLFEDLFNEDEKIASSAYIKLTELDPNTIGKIADEYENSMLRASSSLPIFPFRFIKQLTLLTDHCRKNGIDYKGSDKIKAIFEDLKKELTLSERYELENKIIAELSLEEIKAFEYWASIYEAQWDLTYSAGRIVDKIYARHWNELIADDKKLSLYLKKSKLFKNFGIIGVVNKYLDKFIDSPQNIIARVKTLKTSDSDVSEQIVKILQLKPSSANSEKINHKNVEAPQNLENILEKFASSKLLNDEKRKELFDVLSEINYAQIGTTMKYLEQIDFQNPNKFDSKYEFLTNDWGFNLSGDFDDAAVRKDFSENYSKMSQSQLYAFYLDKHKFDFRKPDKSLDFDKIYEMLKYDVVEAFAGGGGGKRETHIYSLVKLKTNLTRRSGL